MLWADALHAQDARWWRVYGAEAERDFKGDFWCCDPRAEFTNHIEGVDLPGLSESMKRIHLGGNTGYQLPGLAYIWGAVRIILLAYDMQLGPKGETHHFGKHDGGLPNLGADMAEWARRFRELAIGLREKGVEVINASRRTAITCFERLELVEAFKRLGPMDPMTASLLIPQDLLPAERQAFEIGLKAAGYQLGNGLPSVTAVWGARDKACGQTLVAENPYLSGQTGASVALSVGGHNGSGRSAVSTLGRFFALGVKMKPWRKAGGHILVCPSRGLPTSVMPQPEGWVEKTVEELKRHTDREIRVRAHPGNWKKNPPKVPLEADLRDAWACVVWASSAGVKALVEGIPVVYQAPHWICSGAAGNQLQSIESPLMPDRTAAMEHMAAAQFTLEEIESGEPFRKLLGLTVACVLRVGGDYTPEYVRRLRDGVGKHLKLPHRFVCLSDVPVPCERIELKHGWPGWWSKIELFRPDVVTGPTLYLDLDTVIVGDLKPVTTIPYDFAMLNIRAKDTKVGNSGAMWLTQPFSNVYERFAKDPQHWIDYHLKFARNRYMGDQAFISDCFEEIPKLHHALPGFFCSYKYDHCQTEIPAGCSVVCFGGKPRPHQADGWVKKVWV